MAPTPFTAVLVFERGGRTIQMNMKCSDVPGEAYRTPDGSTGFNLPGTANQVYRLKDVMIDKLGTDTTKGEFCVNGKRRGEFIINAFNLNTCNVRQFMGIRLLFAGGSYIKIIQMST